HAAALAHHFEEAGDAGRELRYRTPAGEAATHAGATLEAIAHLERAVRLFDRVHSTSVDRAHALGLLCNAYQGGGRPEECTQVLERMLADAGFGLPPSTPGIVSAMARLALRHVRAMSGLTTPSRPSDPERVALFVETLDCTAGEAAAYTRSAGRVMAMAL